MLCSTGRTSGGARARNCQVGQELPGLPHRLLRRTDRGDLPAGRAAPAHDVDPVEALGGRGRHQPGAGREDSGERDAGPALPLVVARQTGLLGVSIHTARTGTPASRAAAIRVARSSGAGLVLSTTTRAPEASV